jgi:hypothetical protein
LNERQQQVNGFNDLMLVILRKVLGSKQSLLGFLGIFF